MGLSLVAVGTEHTIVETVTQRVLSAGARWALLGGVALYIVAISLYCSFSVSDQQRFLWQTVSATTLVLGLATFGQSLSPIVLEGLLLALLVTKVSLQVLPTKPIEDEAQTAIKFGDSDE